MKLVCPLSEEEISFENSIRPQIFEHFVGQSEIKESLELYVQAAIQRGTVLDHVLLFGPPGLGKTTMANIIANELGAKKFHVTSGAVIQKPSDLNNTLMKIEEGEVLFIDEIHRLPKTVEEFLYTVLEDHAIDLVIDDGKEKTTTRIELAKFTIVGATTRAGMISTPLKNRFGIEYRFEHYSVNELKYIAKRTASILDVCIQDKAAELIAQGSKGTPRETNRLVNRCRDYAQVKGNGIITLDVVQATFKMLRIDKNGLNNMDRKILQVMIEVYGCKPVGINSLSATVDEDEETIVNNHEPFLIQQGYIERTPRGRVITEKGKNLIGGTK